MNPMMIAQMGLGAFGAFGAMQKQKEKERIEEEYNRNAYQGLQRSRDQAENLNPQATSNAALSHLSDAQSAAMAQAGNIGAGQAAASGLGGDVNSAQIGAIKSAAPVMAAAAQFGGQKAQVEQNAFNERLGQNQAISDANSRIASLSQNVNYRYDHKPGVLDAIAGMGAGITAGTNAFEMLTGNGSAKSTGDTAAQTTEQQINAQGMAASNSQINAQGNALAAQSGNLTDDMAGLQTTVPQAPANSIAERNATNAAPTLNQMQLLQLIKNRKQLVGAM